VNDTDTLSLIIIGVIIVVILIVGIKILLKIGKVLLYILLNALLGFIILFLFNLLPFFKIPITILTVLIAGFGGVIGVLLLIVAKALGFY
jgi:inhibitor of the pro-sigma K processing machinery